MDQKDIPFLTTAELSELIRRREVSPVEATSAYLDRINALNFKFNSYLTVCRNEAMAAAEEAERAIARGEYLAQPVGLGPVHRRLQRRVRVGHRRLPVRTSLGEDTGGSIRRPAAWCGIVGLRPSWGRVSRYGVAPGSWSMDQVGPISRTVEDAAITLGAIAGHDPKDPYTWNVPVPDYRSAIGGDLSGVRVGAIRELIDSDIVDPEVRDGVIRAGAVLEELGATMEDVSLPLTVHGGTLAAALINTEASVTYRDWIRERLHEFGHSNQIGLLTGSIMPAQVYHKVQKLRELTRREVLGALSDYDVLILPTSKSCAPLVGDDPVITSKEMARDLPPVMTRPFNLASAPAISINCGFNSQGLPIGLQIGGRPFDESTVLKVAHAYEQHTPWHNMRPPNT